MKKIFSALLAFAAAGSLSAQSLEFLTLRQADGTETSFAVDGLKLTFGNGQLVAETPAAAPQSFALTTLDVMFFDAQATGIECVARPETEQPRIVNGTLTGADGAQVFTIDGKRASTQGLKAGVYIVRRNGLTFKVMAR